MQDLTDGEDVVALDPVKFIGSQAGLTALADLLNEREADGWELVQAFFNADGAVTVWKKER